MQANQHSNIVKTAKSRTSQLTVLIQQSIKPLNATVLLLIITTLGVTSLLSSCSREQSTLRTPTQIVTLVYSSNLDGELEPCGCTIDTDYGGIQRQATVLDTLREQHPTLVLISGGRLLDFSNPLARLKNQFIISGIIEQDYDAIALQAKDLSFGLDLLLQETNKQHLPWVATNSQVNEGAKLDSQIAAAKVPSSIKIIRDKTTFSFFNSSAYKNQQGQTISLEKSVLIEQLKAAKANGEFTILSLEEGDESSNDLIGEVFLDIVIRPERDEFFKDPLKKNNTLILSPGNRGMYLGVLQLTLQDKKIANTYDHRVMPLDNTVEDSPRMKIWYDNYNKAVEAQYQKNAARRKKLSTPVYASEQACKTCHAKEHEIWSQTDHSHAFADLEQVSKAFDPACISCHVVGFDKEGGFINEFHTPNLKNVQCESCHGMSMAHTQNPVHDKPENSDWTMEQVCTQCHNKKHSPKFDSKLYWPKIQH